MTGSLPADAPSKLATQPRAPIPDLLFDENRARKSYDAACTPTFSFSTRRENWLPRPLDGKQAPEMEGR